MIKIELKEKHTMNTKTVRNNKISSISIIGSAISLVLLTSSTQTSAATASLLEQCGGVVKAGLNDCASNEHVCAGLNSDNGNESDWIWLPKGTCEKITDGAVIGTNEKVVDKITTQMESS